MYLFLSFIYDLCNLFIVYFCFFKNSFPGTLSSFLEDSFPSGFLTLCIICVLGGGGGGGGRQHDGVVRALDLKSVGHGFKSLSADLAGVVSQ